MMTATQLAEALAAWPGRIETFVRKLDRDGVPYLSYSKVASVKACPQRYLLEYVQGVDLGYEPLYFVKGRLLHAAAARLHRARQRGRSISLSELAKPIKRRLDEQDTNHVLNALALMRQHLDQDWDVVAVEEPFVLDLGPHLPPLLGIADLVLRRGSRFAVIEHKTGRQFNGPDELQLAIYRQHVRRNHGARTCDAHFDEYRWVNNLDRIRKPARQRTSLELRPNLWRKARAEIKDCYREMQEIESTREAEGFGNCYACPFKSDCDLSTRAEYGGGSLWW